MDNEKQHQFLLLCFLEKHENDEDKFSAFEKLKEKFGSSTTHRKQYFRWWTYFQRGDFSFFSDRGRILDDYSSDESFCHDNYPAFDPFGKGILGGNSSDESICFDNYAAFDEPIYSSREHDNDLGIVRAPEFSQPLFEKLPSLLEKFTNVMDLSESSTNKQPRDQRTQQFVAKKICVFCAQQLKVNDERGVLDCGHYFHAQKPYYDWVADGGFKRCPKSTCRKAAYKKCVKCRTGFGNGTTLHVRCDCKESAATLLCTSDQQQMFTPEPKDCCPFDCENPWEGYDALLDNQSCCVSAPLSPKLIEAERKYCERNGQHFKPVFANLLTDVIGNDPLFSSLSLVFYNACSAKHCANLRTIYAETIHMLYSDPASAGVDLELCESKEKFLEKLEFGLCVKAPETLFDHATKMVQSNYSNKFCALILAIAFKRPIIWIEPSAKSGSIVRMSREDAKRLLPQWDDHSRPKTVSYYLPNGKIMESTLHHPKNKKPQRAIEELFWTFQMKIQKTTYPVQNPILIWHNGYGLAYPIVLSRRTLPKII
ncbi:hypothetical protein niasHT_026391 [Heterodera trifolii]|uniref:Uncharacterized protein n=1 Tax=Heterodera trifolii TaxID=157864 RepID=A0ABD2KPM4_9BILA